MNLLALFKKTSQEPPTLEELEGNEQQIKKAIIHSNVSVQGIQLRADFENFILEFELDIDFERPEIGEWANYSTLFFYREGEQDLYFDINDLLYFREGHGYEHVDDWGIKSFFDNLFDDLEIQAAIKTTCEELLHPPAKPTPEEKAKQREEQKRKRFLEEQRGILEYLGWGVTKQEYFEFLKWKESQDTLTEKEKKQLEMLEGDEEKT